MPQIVKGPAEGRSSERALKSERSRQMDPAAKKRNPAPMPIGRKGPHKRNS